MWARAVPDFLSHFLAAGVPSGTGFLRTLVTVLARVFASSANTANTGTLGMLKSVLAVLARANTANTVFEHQY